ncbi:hypothetical protein [Synoicihabitans lomoniglobus]|uniref:Uncharacterized protein n=1 Tax=Synoicihabitans lomoniglobus TaxID=2909285 RepID=A0AAF0CRW4_9BACT|nr:hypothetical protein [Opitutaceae bacterium LMO-M01]WED66846.1 hypothetical protein PXH66_08285 [Opitutaceae bacterium LMO-M01]
MKKISIPHQSAVVRYRFRVRNEAGEIVRRASAWRRNLILDQGLDGIAVRTWAHSFSNAAIGTGTTPTKRDSGAVTFSRAATTVTASAGFFEAQDVGRLLKWDSGEESYITAFTSATEVTVADSGVVAAAEGTVWYVNQIGLTSEVKRTSNYSSAGGANGTVWSAGTGEVIMTRTYLFSPEAAPIAYREIIWSHTSSVGNNAFGRDLFGGAGVSLIAGQQLEVEMELRIAMSPVEPTPWVTSIAGWSVDGDATIETLGLLEVASNGGLDGSSFQLSEASNANSVVISTATTALRVSSLNDQSLTGIIQEKAMGLEAYVPGSFFRDRSVTLGVSEANSAAIRSIGISNGLGRVGWRVLLDVAETKLSTHTLQLTFRVSWGRTLVN